MKKEPLEWTYICMGASALMLYGSFHPINLGILAWIAWVPLLALTSVRDSYKQIFGLAWVVSFLFHTIGLSWIALCSAEGWLIISFLEAIYTGVSFCLIEYLRRRTKLPYYLVFPLVMTALEFERARFKFFAFPWLLAGQSQHDFDTLIQIADLGGVYLVSFLLFFTNGLLIDIIRTKTQLLERLRLSDAYVLPGVVSAKRLLAGVGIFVALVGGSLLYGSLRKAQVRGQLDESGPRLLLIQTDVPSRNAPFAPPDPLAVTKHLLNLTEREFPKHAGRFDLIVWPETLWYHTFSEDGRKFNQRIAVRGGTPDVRSYYKRVVSRTRRMLNIPKLSNTDILVGSIHREIVEAKTESGQVFTHAVPKHNSVYWVDRTGKTRGRYDKMRPVPASEYVPGKNSVMFHWFYELLSSFVPEGFVSFDPGEKTEIFEINGFKIAPNICFDVSFSDAIRTATENGAEYHVNVSNYSWFRSSAGLDFAVAQGKFRAIETRRAVVKCVNGGPSVSFDADGSISDSGEDLLPHLTQAQLIAEGLGSNAGSIVVDPKTMKGTTLYVLIGDTFAGLCLLSTLILVSLAWYKVWPQREPEEKNVVTSDVKEAA